MEQLRKHVLREKVSVDACRPVAAEGRAGTMRVDVNEGGGANPEYRSRLMAQQVKCHSAQTCVFAETPPIEAKGDFFSNAAAAGVGFERGEREKGFKYVLQLLIERTSTPRL